MYNGFREIFIIMRKESKTVFRKKGYFISVLLFLCVDTFIIMRLYETLILKPAFLNLFLNIYFGRHLVFLTLFLGWTLTPQMFFREKAEKTIESLLATPLTPKIVWIGKSLLVSLVAYFSAVCIIFISILILGLAYSFEFINHTLTVNSILLNFTITPLLCFTLFCLIGGIQFLTNDVRISSFVLFGIAFLYSFLALNKFSNVEVGYIELTSYVVLIIILVLVNTFLGKFLTSERIITSSA